MLSAHNSNILKAECTLKEKYEQSSIKVVLDDIQEVIFSFANNVITKSQFVDYMACIKHKKQLEDIRGAISFLFSYCNDAFEIGLRLLDVVDSLKDSLTLALGNQITYYLVRMKTQFNSLFNLQGVGSTLKKLVILNYMLAQHDTTCEYRDLWNAVTLLESLPISVISQKIKELDKIIDLERDYVLFRNCRGDCFCNHPVLLSIEAKQNLIRIESRISMRQELQDAFFKALFDGVQCPFLTISVRRSHLLEDAIAQFKNILNFRRQLKITFIGEEGVDEGGLQKEFFLLLADFVFNDSDAFIILNDVYIWLKDGENDLHWLAGVLLGLAVYNNVQLDVSFPIALYKSLLSSEFDLSDIDPVLSKSIDHLSDSDNINQEKLRELTKGLDLLKRGFQQVFEPNKSYSIVYNCLTPTELEQLVRGKGVLDLSLLPEIVTYQGGYTKETKVIQWLWELVLSEMHTQQQTNFFRFVTGSDRLPITGLASFCIHRSGPDADRLPTSQTCFNTLLLNEYASKEKLKHYLLMAIENIEGFGLC